MQAFQSVTKIALTKKKKLKFRNSEKQFKNGQKTAHLIKHILMHLIILVYVVYIFSFYDFHLLRIQHPPQLLWVFSYNFLIMSFFFARSVPVQFVLSPSHLLLANRKFQSSHINQAGAHIVYMTLHFKNFKFYVCAFRFV